MGLRGACTIAAVVVALTGVARAQPWRGALAAAPTDASGSASTAPAVSLADRAMPRAWLELGGLFEATRIGAVEGMVDDRQTGALPDPARLAARGFSVRLMLGARTLPGYLGLETTFGWLDAPPTVRPPRAGVVPAPIEADGSDNDWHADMLLGGRAIAGGEGRRGRLFVGGEVAAGVASVQLGGEHEGDPWIHDPRFTLDLRGRAGLWLTPHVSLGMMTSRSLVRSGEWSVQSMLGVAFSD